MASQTFLKFCDDENSEKTAVRAKSAKDAKISQIPPLPLCQRGMKGGFLCVLSVPFVGLRTCLAR